MTKLILLRGNSGSGKTTIARNLQSMLGNGVMRVGQDEIRRHMLNVSDRPDNLAIELIKYITLFGIAHCKYVIVEVFSTKKNMVICYRALFQVRILKAIFIISTYLMQKP